jgi:hypothetical protein
MITPPALPSLTGLAWSRHKKPGFSTRVASHVSGREVRLALYVNPLYEFEAVYNGLTSASSPTTAQAGLGASSLQSLMGFFLQMQGQYNTFLYTDPDDSTISSGAIGTGNGSTQTFTITRALGGFTEPCSWVTNVANVYLNGVSQASNTWALIAPNTIAFAVAPSFSVNITADFTFAFQCRFLDDQLDFEEFMSTLWKLDSMKFRSVTANTTPAAVPAPTVTAISPSSGPMAGGTSVTISGTFFEGATAVTIDGIAATSVVVVSSTSITATTGTSATAGIGNVVVTTPYGTGTGVGLYTYTTWDVTYEIGGTLPLMFADFTTEGGTNHYLYNGTTYAGSAAWLTAVGAMFSRSSSAYYTNSSGTLSRASSGALRFDHDNSGNPLGILLEGASTNLMGYSQLLNGSGWGGYNYSVTVNTGTAPDGTTTDNLVVPNTSSAYHGITNSLFSGTSGTWNTSVYVKPSGATTYYVGIRNASTGATVAFNLSGSGSVIATGTGWSNAAIIKLSDGHYRISANYTGGSSSAYPSWFVLPTSYTSGDPLSSGNQFAGDGTSGLYMWGSQIESFTFPSSYIPTTSSSATRAADSLEIPWTSATATFRTKTLNLNEHAGNERLIGTTIADGPLYTASATSLGTTQATAGALTQSSAVTSWASSNVAGAAGSSSGRAVGANNVTLATDTNALFSATPSDIFIGSSNGSSDFSYGDFAQFGAWTVAATSTQLQAMTNTP